MSAIVELRASVAPSPVQSPPRPGTSAQGSIEPAPGPELEETRPPDEKPTKAEDVNVMETVERLNDLIQTVRRELHFMVDDTSGSTVIQVIDTETQQVVRQIPPEEVLTLVHRFEDMGSLLSSQA